MCWDRLPSLMGTRQPSKVMLGPVGIVWTADSDASVLPKVVRETATRTVWLVLCDSGQDRRRCERDRVGSRHLVQLGPTLVPSVRRLV